MADTMRAEPGTQVAVRLETCPRWRVSGGDPLSLRRRVRPVRGCDKAGDARLRHLHRRGPLRYHSSIGRNCPIVIRLMDKEVRRSVIPSLLIPPPSLHRTFPMRSISLVWYLYSPRLSLSLLSLHPGPSRRPFVHPLSFTTLLLAIQIHPRRLRDQLLPPRTLCVLAHVFHSSWYSGCTHRRRCSVFRFFFAEI